MHLTSLGVIRTCWRRSEVATAWRRGLCTGSEAPPPPPTPPPAECVCRGMEENVCDLSAPMSSVRVALMGADTPAGQATALALKTSPLFSEIRLHGEAGWMRGLALDLSHLPTPSAVLPFSGPNQLIKALSRADVVLVDGGRKEGSEGERDLLELNATLIRKVATACVVACPQAVMVINIEPVNGATALFSEVLKEMGALCSERVVGMVNAVGAARWAVARRLGLEPRTVWVPLAGGASSDTVVPLVSIARPGGPFLSAEAEDIISEVRCAALRLRQANQGRPPSLSAGHTVASFLEAIAKGLCGKRTAYPGALVHAELVPGVELAVAPVELGLGGVAAGGPLLPAMSPWEAGLVERAVPLLAQQLYSARELAKCSAPSGGTEQARREAEAHNSACMW